MITVTRYTASWCIPCKAYGPVFDQVAELFDEVDFQVVSHDDEGGPLKFDEAGIVGVPTTVLERNGKFIAAHTGPMQYEELVGFINKARIDVALRA